jgi:DNA-binding transcriptional LysR family regulator
MNMPEKAKDGPKARKDLEFLNIREDLKIDGKKSSEDMDTETEDRGKKVNKKEELYCPLLLHLRSEGGILGLPNLPDRFDTVPLYDERYVVAFPPGHRFEGLTVVPMGEMSDENYLQRANCEFSANFSTFGIERPYSHLNVRYRSEREEWIQAMILAGLGCSFMPEYMPLFPGLRTRVLTEPEVKREIKLVTVAGRQYSPATRMFMELANAYDWHKGV